MKFQAIVAMSDNRVIGKDNRLPWHLPADLQHFKSITWGKTIVMGRKTFLSIGHVLPGRENIVLTRDTAFNADGGQVLHSLAALYDWISKYKEVFIIGGAEIFQQCLPKIERIYLTLVHHEFSGDIFFPELNMKEWKQVSRDDFKADAKNQYDYSFLVLERID